MSYIRYLIKFSYDGSKYEGYQKQLGSKKTVQKEIESVLRKLNSNEKVSLVASGRTDRGVHAIAQYAHFDFKDSIPKEKLIYAMNRLLSKYIYIKDISIVDSAFHARFDVLRKRYKYIINIGEYNPILSDYEYQYNKDLNISLMKEAIKLFEGEHDFKSFAKATDKRESYTRIIYETSIKLEDSKVIITFTGSGFLRYMVRNMVGLLIEIGEGKKKKEDINRIFNKKDRKASGKTALPEGLYLEEVWYK